MRRATYIIRHAVNLHSISIHALLAESDGYRPASWSDFRDFYPRSPCGERQSCHCCRVQGHGFLSTLSLRRATPSWIPFQQNVGQFLSTLSLRRATGCFGKHKNSSEFLSTLSLRRATVLYSVNRWTTRISIHALLAESDPHFRADGNTKSGFLSTLSLRRATLPDLRLHSTATHFYPRSPCGERRFENPDIRVVSDFYPRSPCGERPTNHDQVTKAHQISIHALLAESDDTWARGSRVTYVISIHALLAESDSIMITITCIASRFLSTLSLRRATELV